MVGTVLTGRAWLGTLVRVLFYVCLPLVLVTTNVRFAFNEERVYKYSIDHYNAAAVTGIAHSDLIAATADIRAYFNNNQDLLRTRVHDSSGNVVPLFHPKEVLHMRDVKHLLQRVYAIETLALCFVLAYVVAICLWSGAESLQALAMRALRASILTIALVVGFGVVASTGFDALFTRFHELSFGNDFWQLDPATDHLVQMFPQGFWLDATVLIAGLTVVEAAIIGGVAWMYLRRREKRAQPDTPALHSETSDRSEDVTRPVV